MKTTNRKRTKLKIVRRERIEQKITRSKKK